MQTAVHERELEQAEDGQTVHDRALEADAAPRLCGLGRDAPPVPGDRPLVGGDDVHPEVEGGLDVAGRDRGEVLLHDGELDEHVGAGGGEELGGRPRRLGQRRPLGRRRQHRGRLHSFRVRAGCRAASRRPSRRRAGRARRRARAPAVASSAQRPRATLPKPSRQSLTVLADLGRPTVSGHQRGREPADGDDEAVRAPRASCTGTGRRGPGRRARSGRGARRGARRRSGRPRRRGRARPALRADLHRACSRRW